MKNQYGIEFETLPLFNLITDKQTRTILNTIYFKPDPNYKANIKVEYVNPFSGQLTKESVLSAELHGSLFTLHLESGGSIRIDVSEFKL